MSLTGPCCCFLCTEVMNDPETETLLEVWVQKLQLLTAQRMPPK